MRVVLEATSGPSAGRKVLLGAGQVLQVGRTEWADFAVPHDGHMSGVHFALETDNAACYVKDLGSTNGTQLNGQPLSDRRTLRNGDEIVAGETHFRVRVEGEALEERLAAEPGVAAGPAVLPMPPAAPAAARPAKVFYTVERCETGLTLCRGNVGEIHPTDLAHLMSRTAPLFITVDVKKLGRPPPGNFACTDYLFDWLGPEAAAVVSPVLLAQQDSEDWPAVLEAGWGSDAVICFFSKQDKQGLLEHLRCCLRANRKRDERITGMLGICWPSVLAMLLAYGPQALVRGLVAGIEAILIELPDLPETWQVYGGVETAELLDALGLVRKAAV
jgi:pSer/pThr/pTyr-binding forkhead associated (FHA) protein